MSRPPSRWVPRRRSTRRRCGSLRVTTVRCEMLAANDVPPGRELFRSASDWIANDVRLARDTATGGVQRRVVWLRTQERSWQQLQEGSRHRVDRGSNTSVYTMPVATSACPSNS